MKPKITYKPLNIEELIKENKKITKRAGQPSLISCSMCFKVINNHGFVIKIDKKEIMEEKTYCSSCFKEIKSILNQLNINIKKVK